MRKRAICHYVLINKIESLSVALWVCVSVSTLYGFRPTEVKFCMKILV